MEIPQNVQEKLKCSECDELLSCGPVYILHETGGAICGRCDQQSKDSTKPKNNRTRNEPYEATASLLAFPCAFAAHGCREKLPFSLGHPPHELNCKFRPLICPIASRGSCDWVNPWTKLKDHCIEKHPRNILENPCNPPRPDLTISNLQTYVISALQFLFLLQIKVCATSGKLFHSLRMFGDQKYLEKFSFTLEIEGNGVKVTKSGSVLRAGILTIQEPTAICTTINHLLGILDGNYNESKFTIRIQGLIQDCVNCLNTIDDGFDSEFCVECRGKLVKCGFNRHGCLFMDVDSEKRKKHEIYFCKFQTKCWECYENFIDGSFIEHMCFSKSCQQEIIQANFNSVVRVKNIDRPDSYYTFVFLSSNNIGSIVCAYCTSSSNFELYLYTSLQSYKLKNYKCTIKLTDPQTKHTQIFTPPITYNNWHDWCISKKMFNFPSSANIGIDMKINIDNI